MDRNDSEATEPKEETKPMGIYGLIAWGMFLATVAFVVWTIWG